MNGIAFFFCCSGIFYSAYILCCSASLLSHHLHAPTVLSWSILRDRVRCQPEWRLTSLQVRSVSSAFTPSPSRTHVSDLCSLELSTGPELSILSRFQRFRTGLPSLWKACPYVSTCNPFLAQRTLRWEVTLTHEEVCWHIELLEHPYPFH